MSQFIAIESARAEGKAKALLDAVQKKLGVTPNMTRVMASSPAVLEGYLSFNGALAGGELGAKLREQIALVTAESNACEYCLSAHSFIGKGAGLTAAEIDAARHAGAVDAKAKVALEFARTLIVNRGNVAGRDVDALREAGFGDGAIGEIIANVALNVFTNYFNNVTRPTVDFPVVTPGTLAKAA
jgi:uncharacterized peroxidase-related enzyme